MFTMSSGKLIITLLFTTECLSKRTKPCQAEAKYKDGGIYDTISRPRVKQKNQRQVQYVPPKVNRHKVLM